MRYIKDIVVLTISWVAANILELFFFLSIGDPVERYMVVSMTVLFYLMVTKESREEFK